MGREEEYRWSSASARGSDGTISSGFFLRVTVEETSFHVRRRDEGWSMRAGTFCCHWCYQMGTSHFGYFHLLVFSFFLFGHCPHKTPGDFVKQSPASSHPPSVLIRLVISHNRGWHWIRIMQDMRDCRRTGVLLCVRLRSGRDKAYFESGEWMKARRTFACNYMYYLVISAISAHSWNA